MKRNYLLFLLIGLSTHSFCQDQSFKVGVFDIDIMVQTMPSYHSSVDSVLQVYAQDSLSQEYGYYQQEYARVDSSYRIDSALKKSQAILDIKDRQRQELAFTLINFQRIAESKMERKRVVLSQPLYDKVMTAYRKVMAEKKYMLIVKPNTYEVLSHVENVFIPVAAELKVNLPKQLANLR